MGIRISEMEEAATFGADDYVPIVTSGTNKKALGSKIKAFIKGGFAAARAVVTDAEGNLSTSNVTSAELSNLSGIDRNINGYLTNKAFTSGMVVDNLHSTPSSNQDYNGIYWVAKTQWSDMPKGTYGFLEVNGGLQRFTPYSTSGTGEIYVRIYANSTWTPWKRVPSLTSCSITRHSGVSSSVPVPTITRRNDLVIIHFVLLIPAGTYTNLWDVTPAPTMTEHACVIVGNGQNAIKVETNGVVAFNNSTTITGSGSYLIGQLVYATEEN